jgi:voltage-gated potassium channel
MKEENVNEFDLKSIHSQKDLQQDSVFFKKKKFMGLIYKSRKRFQKANKHKSTQITYILLYLILSNLMNAISIIIYIIQTMLEDSNIINTLNIIDAVVATYFIIEYVTLLLRHTGNKANYFLTWTSFIEITSIFNSYFVFFASNNTYRFQFFRMFRIVRIYKVMRIYKSLQFFKNIIANNENTIRTNPIKLQFVSMVIILICYLFVGTGIILAASDILPAFGFTAFTQQNMNFFDAFYYMIATSMTIGYGDIFPTSGVSRLLVIFVLFGFFAIISDQISKLASLLSIWGHGLVEYDGTGHIIVILDNLYSFDHFLVELRQKEPTTDIVILSTNVEELGSNNYLYENVSLIHGNRIGYDTFMRANLLNAKVVFIIAPKNIGEKNAKEQLSEFTLLKVNDHNPDIPIYVQTLYEEYNNINYRWNISFSNESDTNNNKPENKSFRFKKVIPAFKIKTMIHAKSCINPGFACFIQNLLFNKNNYFIDRKKYTSPLLNSYLAGCEYKLKFHNPPSCFIGKTFNEILYSLYIRSISDYLQKASTNDYEVRSILTIGVVDKQECDDSEESFYLFPHNYIIHEETQLVFICYNDDNYIKKFFDTIETETFDRLAKQDKSNKNKTFLEGAKRLKRENSNRSNKSKKEELLILNEMKELNQYYYSKNRGNKVENFGLGLLNNLISKNVPETYEDFKKKDIKKVELTKETYVEKLLNEQKRKDSNIGYKLYNISEIANLDNLVDDCSKGQPDSVLVENLEALKFNKSQSNNLNFEREAHRYYGQYKSPIQCNEPLINNERIKNIEKDHSKTFKNHFLIIGYQSNIHFLIKLIHYHYPLNDICIINHDHENESSIKKLLVDFSQLYYLKGNNLSPFHLLNAGINNAFKCIFLVENIDKILNDDINKLLSFRSIDYFFKQDTIIELWTESNIKYLGYSPLTETDIFQHPLYMSGSVLYMSHLEKILAQSYIAEHIQEAWMSLITCGYDVVEKYIPQRECYPVVITIDIPEYYHGLDYYMLVTDLLEQDSPVIPLGIYVKNPKHYYSKAHLNAKRVSDQSMLNVAKRLSTIYDLENEYKSYLEILKHCSYNNKPYLDYVDIGNCMLPIFITNPSPGFVIQPKTQVTVLINHKIRHNEYHYKGNDIFKFKNLSIAQNYTKKTKLVKTVNRFYYLFNKIKENVNQDYRNIVDELNKQIDEL